MRAHVIGPGDHDEDGEMTSKDADVDDDADDNKGIRSRGVIAKLERAAATLCGVALSGRATLLFSLL